MEPSASKIPQEPGVNRSESKLTPGCHLPCSFNIVKDPFYLRGREIGINYQPGPGGDSITHALLAESVTIVGRSSVLPHNGIADRLSRYPVPYHRCLTLVGNSY